jgi:hypothetical protein
MKLIGMLRKSDDPVEGASPNVSRFCVRRDFGFLFSQVASHTDYESTQTGELEPSNPEILCRELQMENCAGVFFVLIMFKQLSDGEKTPTILG